MHLYQSKEITYERTMNAQQVVASGKRMDKEEKWIQIIAVFVPGHISHPAWKEKLAQEPEYFRKACDRLQSLASWFFEGQSPF